MLASEGVRLQSVKTRVIFLGCDEARSHTRAADVYGTSAADPILPTLLRVTAQHEVNGSVERRSGFTLQLYAVSIYSMTSKQILTTESETEPCFS